MPAAASLLLTGKSGYQIGNEFRQLEYKNSHVCSFPRHTVISAAAYIPYAKTDKGCGKNEPPELRRQDKGQYYHHARGYRRAAPYTVVTSAHKMTAPREMYSLHSTRRTVVLCIRYSVFPRLALRDYLIQPLIGAITAWGYLPRCDCRRHGAARFFQMCAVIEAALAYVRGEINKVVL